MSELRMRINGVDLYVEPAAGDGEPVVLVHGGWTDHGTWAALVPALARSFRVVTYDRRGHSRSERGPTPPPRRLHEDDLAALIEALGEGPVHLVGSSYGAAIALALAGRRPELVHSVVAHEPLLIDLVPAPAAAAAMQSVATQLAAGDVERGTRRFFEDVALGPGGWEKVPEPIQRAAVGNAQTYVDMYEDPHWAALDVARVRRFPGPIVVTRGDSGPAWLPYVALGVAERIGRESRVIAGAGHSPHLTHPDPFAALIADFIGGQALRRAA
jgi:pimeloyl-ACP methyl ester carboxylesterase